MIFEVNIGKQGHNIDIIWISIIFILIFIMLSNMWRVCFRIFEVNIGKRGLTEND